MLVLKARISLEKTVKPMKFPVNPRTIYAYKILVNSLKKAVTVKGGFGFQMFHIYLMNPHCGE